MRQELETKLVNCLFPYRAKIPYEDIKAQITIILSEYEIEKRHTEVAIRDEDKTQDEIIAILKKNHVIVDDPKKPGRPKKAQEDNKTVQADIPEIVFTLVADNLEKVSKDIQAEEVKLSDLYKQKREMMGFLADNGILKQQDDKQTEKELMGN